MKVILIVDDDKSTIFGLSVLLANKHVATMISDNYDRAIEIIDSETIDILITDFNLQNSDPSKTGLDIAKKAKMIMPDTKVILMTGYSDPNILLSATSSGVDYFFVKPISFEKLSSVIAEIIGLNF
jgi:DNA-binding NtrC family response regulator